MHVESVVKLRVWPKKCLAFLEPGSDTSFPVASNESLSDIWLKIDKKQNLKHDHFFNNPSHPTVLTNACRAKKTDNVKRNKEWLKKLA